MAANQPSISLCCALSLYIFPLSWFVPQTIGLLISLNLLGVDLQSPFFITGTRRLIFTAMFSSQQCVLAVLADYVLQDIVYFVLVNV